VYFILVNYKELYSIISDFISNPKVEMSKGDIYLLIDSLKEDLNIILYEYTDFDEQAKVSLDGFTVYDGENYIIFYNTQRKKRIRFTLGHELGHIILGHFLLESVPSSVEIQADLEIEANIFSRCINLPARVISTHRLIFGDDLVERYLSSKNFSSEFIKTAFIWQEEDLNNLVYPTEDYFQKAIQEEVDELFELQKVFSKKVD
jgi:hypothetical protein